jgi:predicted flap endonuclease-1-like 5' DNA nuclease
MSAFACCFWWFLLGLLLGWLLNWLLSKWTRKDDSGSGGNSYNAPSHASNAYSGSAGGSTSGSMGGSANGTTGGSVSSNMGAAGLAALAAVAGADVAKAAAAGFKIRGNDDLEAVEGIGPKISGLFKDNGVNTFGQLSAMSVAEMNVILEKGGSRFKLANPGTWAKQALLCHENRWVELRALQDDLTAGIDKSAGSTA